MGISNLPKHRGTPSSSTTSPHSKATPLKARLTLPSNSLLRATLATLHSLVLLASHSGGRQRREKAFTVDPKLFRIDSSCTKSLRTYMFDTYICSFVYV